MISLVTCSGKIQYITRTSDMKERHFYVQTEVSTDKLAKFDEGRKNRLYIY